jgi:hypothetical protein
VSNQTGLHHVKNEALTALCLKNIGFCHVHCVFGRYKIFEEHAACMHSLHFTADNKTSMLPVMLQSPDAVELALKLDGEDLNKRKLRVQRCIKKPTRQSGSNHEHKTVKKRNQKFKESLVKTQNNEEMNMVEEHEDKEDVFNLSNSDTEPDRKNSKPSQKLSAFQGQKVTADKKLGKVMSPRILFMHVIYTLSLTKNCTKC